MFEELAAARVQGQQSKNKKNAERIRMIFFHSTSALLNKLTHKHIKAEPISITNTSLTALIPSKKTKHKNSRSQNNNSH